MRATNFIKHKNTSQMLIEKTGGEKKKHLHTFFVKNIHKSSLGINADR